MKITTSNGVISNNDEEMKENNVKANEEKHQWK